MNRFIVAGILLFCVVTTYSQKNNLAPLNFGDQLSTSYFSNASYYSNSKYGNNSTRPKLTILDFWGVHCSPCIKEMPEIQEYQNRFGDKIQVYLVTRDSKADIDLLYNKIKLFREINLPIIYQDTALSQLFPYNAYGLHVWLDSNGRLVKKTEGPAYSGTEIDKFLAGENVNLIERNDRKDFNRNEWITAEGNGRQQKYVQYYSAITSRISDVGGSSTRTERDRSTNQFTAIRTFNNSATGLLLIAFGELGSRPIFKTIFKTNDSSRYFPPNQEQAANWNIDYSYCYELRVSADRSKYFFNYMRSDLTRFFNLSGQIKKRRIPVLELYQSGKGKELKTQGGKATGQYPDPGLKEDSLILRNSEMSGLIEEMGILFDLPSFDKTKIKTNIDISLIDPHGSIDDLNLQLRKYGLKLKKREKRLPVLILADSK